MTFPEDLLYTKDHEWVRIDGGVATIGVTDFAQKELGDIVYVELSSLNEEFEQHDIFGTIEAVKTVSDLFMPLGGTIIQVNESLEHESDLVNKDPYGKGWMIKVQIKGEIPNNLMDSYNYRKMLGV